MEKFAAILQSIKTIDMYEPTRQLNFDKAERAVAFLKKAGIQDLLGTVGGFFKSNPSILPMIMAGLGGSFGGGRSPMMGLLMALLGGAGGFFGQKALFGGEEATEEEGVTEPGKPKGSGKTVEQKILGKSDPDKGTFPVTTGPGGAPTPPPKPPAPAPEKKEDTTSGKDDDMVALPFGKDSASANMSSLLAKLQNFNKAVA
jgi:hypothetical protein